MGRNRKIIDISTGKVGKQSRSDRAEAEQKLKVGRDQLTAPEWLDDIARAEFDRVVREAASINLLDNLDLGFLAIYANAWSGYSRMVQYIQVHSEIASRESANDTYDVLSPYMRAEEKYIAQIMQCSSKLGLSTSDRLKLVVPVKHEDKINKYLKYLEKA